MTCDYINASQVNQLNCTPSKSEGDRLWVSALTFFPVFTMIGNVFVVLAVIKEKTLQTVTNYFIVSLAIADIMVGILVMPLAIWVEVNNQQWRSSHLFCDIFVMLDCLFCTASILNLVAISFDRYVAVTHPILYRRHRNSKRVYVTVVLTWFISTAIALPIGLGMNHTDGRSDSECRFFNANFVIYSSFGSFVIPGLFMLWLYYKVFRVIRQRARRSTASTVAHKGIAAGIRATVTQQEETAIYVACNRSYKEPTASGGDDAPVNNHDAQYLSPSGSERDSDDDSRFPTPDASATTSSTVITKSTVGVYPPHAHHQFASSVNAVDESCYHTSLLQPPTATANSNHHHSNCDSGSSTYKDMASYRRVYRKRIKAARQGNSSDSGGHARAAATPKTGSGKRRFEMLVHSKKIVKQKKERTSAKKERKATKTLAIVLGAFLFCWTPFFFASMANAFCEKYASQQNPPLICQIPSLVMSCFVWLGYVNSFLNPVIYTIFNAEFRKAFKNILFSVPCYRK